MWWDEPVTKPARRPVEGPRVEPRVEDDARPRHFRFIHECVNRTIRTVVLPVGRASWHWDPETSTVTPELSCPTCGTAGTWTEGKWKAAKT